MTNPLLSVMTSSDDCIPCPAGQSCPTGSDAGILCAPGTNQGETGKATCDLCVAGKYQGSTGATSCEECTRGSYCARGSSTPSPCPGGTYANSTSLTSVGQCVPVEAGYWAPTGSALPRNCPQAGFYCPGALDVDAHTETGIAEPGSLPIFLPPGSTLQEVEVVVEEQVVTGSLTLTGTEADFDADAQLAFRTALAAELGISLSSLVLDVQSGATSGRRQLQSGIVVQYTITVPVDAAPNTTATAVLSDPNALAAIGLNVTSAAPPTTQVQTRIETRVVAVQDNTTQVPMPPPPPPGNLIGTDLIGTCPAGRRVPVGGSQCIDCEGGGFCAGGVFTPCQLGTWSTQPTATNISTCQQCPSEGVSCTDGSAIDVLPGWYLAGAGDNAAFRCATAKACIGGRNAIGNATCQVGYSDLLCGRCVDDFYRGRRQCLPCDSATGDDDGDSTFHTALLIFVISVLSFGAMMLYLRPPNGDAFGKTIGHVRMRLGRTQLVRNMPQYIMVASALAKITLGYTQCLGAIIRFPLVAWPTVFTDFIETLDVLNLEIFAVVPAECITGTRLGFLPELLATLFAPLACALVVMLGVLATDQIDRTFGTRGPYASWADFRGSVLTQIQHPRCCKLLIWAILLLYPSISRKSLAVFDCMPAGSVSLLRDDPAVECWQGEWIAAAIFAGIGTLVYCVGVPLGAFCIARRYHLSAKDDLAQRERVVLIVGTYQAEYWYVESIVLLHRFIFTGAIHNIAPESRVQLFVGGLLSFLAFVLFILTKPFRHELANVVGGAALLQLLFTYNAAQVTARWLQADCFLIACGCRQFAYSVLLMIS